MPDVESIPDQPPFLGPQLPLYPPREGLIRIVAGTAPSSGNVYLGFLQQFNPPLGLRDRIQVYLQEPNSFLLAGGFYDGVLMSSFNGLPLYVTTCCLTEMMPAVGVSGSSSASATSVTPTGGTQVWPYLDLDFEGGFPP